MVGGDDVIERGAVARVEAVERAPDLRLDQPAHFQHARADRLELGIELLRQMFGRAHCGTTLCLMTGHGAMHAGRHETATIRKYAAAMLRRLIGAAGVAPSPLAAAAPSADTNPAGATRPDPSFAQRGDAQKKTTPTSVNYPAIRSRG